MTCPLHNRCHAKLSEQLKQARLAHKESLREAAEVVGGLKRRVSVLEWQLSQRKIGIEDMSEAGRKRRSGYSVRLQSEQDNPCSKCESIEGFLNHDDKIKYKCGDFLHRVNAMLGGCPHHSDLIAKERVA